MAYFSYSQLAFYRKCPYRYWLERIQKVAVPLDERRHYVGTVMAMVLDQFYKQEHWRHRDVLTRMAADVDTAALQADSMSTLPWVPGERERALVDAKGLLPRILGTLKRERLLGLVNHTEFHFELPLGRDRVIGTADLIVESPGGEPGLWVLDGKAGGTLGRHVHVHQLRFYALCLLNHPLFARLPDRLGFWWFRHDTVQWKKVSVSILDKTKAQVEATIAALRAKEFPTKPTRDCRLCDVRSHCPDGQAYMKRVLASRPALDIPENAGEVSL